MTKSQLFLAFVCHSVQNSSVAVMLRFQVCNPCWQAQILIINRLKVLLSQENEVELIFKVLQCGCYFISYVFMLLLFSTW